MDGQVINGKKLKTLRVKHINMVNIIALLISKQNIQHKGNNVLNKIINKVYIFYIENNIYVYSIYFVMKLCIGEIIVK